MSEWTLIPIQDIIITPAIVREIKRETPEFDEKTYTVIDDGTFGLDIKRLKASIEACKG